MKMKELLADPASWTKRELARDKSGQGCDTDNPLATSFCLIGALVRCYDADDDSCAEIFKRLETAIINRLAGSTVDDISYQFSPMVFFNDAETTTHADILAVLNEADV